MSNFIARIKKLEAAFRKRLKRGVIVTMAQLTNWCADKPGTEPNLSPRLAKFVEVAMAAEDDPCE